MNTTIRHARPADHAAIAALQRTWSNQIGFLSHRSLATYLHTRQILVAVHNRHPIAYLLGRLSLAWQPHLAQIVQIAVHPAHLRQDLATRLLAAHAKAARKQNAVGIQAICRADLAANAFWLARGFKQICFLTPNTARKKPLIVWRLPLNSKLPIWFASPPHRAGTHGSRPRPAERKGIPHHGHDPRRWLLPCHTAPQRTHTARRTRTSELATRRRPKTKTPKAPATPPRAPMDQR